MGGRLSLPELNSLSHKNKPSDFFLRTFLSSIARISQDVKFLAIISKVVKKLAIKSKNSGIYKNRLE